MHLLKSISIALFITAVTFSGGVLMIVILAGKNAEPLTIGTSDSTLDQQQKQSTTEHENPKIELPDSAMLDAPIIKQRPELYNGCELTSLTMLLQYYGIQKDKMELVPEMKKDPTLIQYDKQGNISFWGNPHTGFVGDITGKQKGYSISHTALFKLLKSYIPTGMDLTGSTFEKLEQQVTKGIPVIAWTTVDYKVPDNWIQWESPTGPVRATFSIHTVLIVGFDKKYVFVNDPLSGVKGQKILKSQFVKSWNSVHSQALSYQ